MRVLSSMPFCPCDGRRVSPRYLSAAARYTTMLRDPRPNPMERPKIEERCKHHPLHRELLNAMQQGLPPGPVTLPRLLLKQRIDLRIAPIRVGAFGVDERLHAGRGVAGGS